VDVKAPESSIKDFSVLQDPAIQTATATGKFINEYALPTNLNMQNKKRSRNNGVLEGLTFNNNYSTLFTNVEEPLYEDDQCLNNKGGMIRLFAFDAKAVKTPYNTATY
jgi:hypothetical protein